MQVTTIGLDIAKNVLQVHGIDAAEKVVVRKQLRRSQVLVLRDAAGLPVPRLRAGATNSVLIRRRNSSDRNRSIKIKYAMGRPRRVYCAP